MRHLLFVALVTAFACGEWASSLSAQAQHRFSPPRVQAPPDLQGIWADNTITPFERPPELAGRKTLTKEEVRTLRERAARLFSGSGDIAPGDELFLTLLENPAEHKSARRPTGDYNQFWLDDGLVFDNRTSQIVDPSDGRLPPLTPEAQQRLAASTEQARAHPADGPESRATQERCLTFGTARIGALQSRNNSYHQIIQTGHDVVIHSEMIHEARIIPMDGRPHLPPAVRKWSGDSRGRWEGTTLVIDTTNFNPQVMVAPKPGFRVSAEHLHLVERLKLVDSQTLRYEATIEDPTTWTRPWTAATIWKRSDKPILEFACHEANYALEHILSGARDEESRQKGGAPR